MSDDAWHEMIAGRDAEIERLRRGYEILKASNLNGTGQYDAYRIIQAALAGDPIPAMPTNV